MKIYVVQLYFELECLNVSECEEDKIDNKLVIKNESSLVERVGVT